MWTVIPKWGAAFLRCRARWQLGPLYLAAHGCKWQPCAVLSGCTGSMASKPAPYACDEWRPVCLP